jgi:hypothetical protein
MSLPPTPEPRNPGTPEPLPRAPRRKRFASNAGFILLLAPLFAATWAYLAQRGEGVRLVRVDDVIYFKASDKYTEVITRQGESLIRKPIFISPERSAAEAGPYFIWRLSSWPPRR